MASWGHRRGIGDGHDGVRGNLWCVVEGWRDSGAGVPGSSASFTPAVVIGKARKAIFPVIHEMTNADQSNRKKQNGVAVITL